MQSKRKPISTAVLLDKHTPYQHMVLRRDARGLLLSLNGSPQVHTAEEREYHDCIATVPLLLSWSINDVLILGGGDGLAARNVLEFSDVRSCTLVELDREMIAHSSQDPLWSQLNEGSLSNPRMNVIIGDGIEWMIKTKQRFDIIIHDLEMSFTDQPESMTTERLDDFFSAMYRQLNPGGIWVITVDVDYDERVPDAFFSAHESEFTQDVRTSYRRRHGAIAKIRFLLQQSFPCVHEITINPQALGKHTTFFISNESFGTWRRTPPKPLTVKWPRQGLRSQR
jgi:predicted membrane-bound spermidine synthase